MKQQYDKAVAHTEDDVARCRGLLIAVQEGVTALEREYDEILVEAQTLSDSDIERLRLRTLTYLEVHQILPELKRVTGELAELRKRLKANADRFLNWPWKKSDKQVAVQDFEKTLDTLKRYLDDLVGQVGSRPSHSGVQLEELEALLRKLDEGDAEQVRSIAVELKRDTTRAGLDSYTTRIGEVVQQLEGAFR